MSIPPQRNQAYDEKGLPISKKLDIIIIIVVIMEFWVVALLLLGTLLVDVSSAYQQVVRAGAADPSIVYAHGWYHMTYTTATDIEMVRSRTLKGLLVGKVRPVYTEFNLTAGREANIWAPEIHQIDQVWYIFYSSGNGSEDCETSCRPRVLEGCEAPTPFYCSYRWRADLVPPAGYQGGSDGRDPFGIDASFLEIPGRGRYVLLSGKNQRSVQSIQIGPLNTTSWNVTSWHVISEPDQPWEKNVSNSRPRELWIGGIAINEGPHPLYHDGQIWITYSGSHCQTPNYGLGLLRYNGGDPLQRSSWIKSPKPVLFQANGNYGTGHNCFFNSPDGKETWIAYHATLQKHGACDGSRFTIAQPIRFVGNNTPTFEIPPNLDTYQDPPSGENFTSQAMEEGEMPFDGLTWM